MSSRVNCQVDDVNDKENPKPKALSMSPIFILAIIIHCLITAANSEAAEREQRATSIYREQFETYETLHRHKIPLTPAPTNPPVKRQQGRTRTRYVEFAETEFSRPSFYFPVPFRVPQQNRVQIIPARTLSQLIRQHIARNRQRASSINSPVRQQQHQSRTSEFRQTPFRRWPNSTRISYEEKRRQWKAELKRRLEGEKQPARTIPPLLISGGGYSSIQTDKEPEDRYYVTYSPQTRIYQVSRRPPPYLYTTGQDELPEQLEGRARVMEEIISSTTATTIEDIEQGEPTYTSTTEETTTTEMAMTTVTPMEETTPSTTMTTTTTEEPTTEPSTTITTATTTEEPTTTTTEEPLIAILQSAKLVPGTLQGNENAQRITATKERRPESTKKQVLFLDDYEQAPEELEEENSEEEEMTETTTTAATTTTTPAPIIPMPTAIVSPTAATTRSTVGDRRAELDKARERLRQQLYPPIPVDDDDDEEFVEEENEDEDLFFFKPGGNQQAVGDPFRIEVHNAGRKLL